MDSNGKTVSQATHAGAPLNTTAHTAHHDAHTSTGSTVASGGVGLREEAAAARLRGLYTRALAILHPFAAAHDRFVEYQRTLPVRTVVPEPPNTLRDYVRHQLWRLCRASALFFFFLFTWPVWLTLHVLLLLLDLHQRRVWLRHHHSWPHESQPHLRANTHQPSRDFPLDGWHLRCEDGRQRWYYGAPLREGEVDNELGLAQLCGLHSVADYHDLLRRRAASDRESEEAGTGLDALSSNGDTARVSGNDANDDPLTSRVPWLPDILEEKCEKRSFVERYQIGLTPPAAVQPRTTTEAAMDDGIRFLLRLQDPFSGHWPNTYSGALFLSAGLVFTRYIVAGGETHNMFPPCTDHHHVKLSASAMQRHRTSGKQQQQQQTAAAADGPERVLGVATGDNDGELPCRCGEAMQHELIRYLRNHQNRDGGWGQHTEGHSTMLGTVLNYVSLRLLGVSASDAQVTEARNWIAAHGGAVTMPMWGRVWLCILGLYSWEGLHPIPPELSLLPNWVPFSMGRSWCHSRVIAYPFSYFYGLRWSAPTFPTTLELRGEIYTEAYSNIAWRSYRGQACELDLYTPPSPLFRFAMGLFDLYERHPIRFLRRYALEECWKHIAYDDENTNFICLGPVNKFLNMLVTWLREGEHSVRFQEHCDRVPDYFFMQATGMTMSGYNGSQLWDTSFAVQAICACRREMMYPVEMELAHHYIDVAQVLEDPMAAAEFHRAPTRGAWNFSTRAQGWQVSDCTAEGLRVALLLPQYDFPVRRIFDGVDEILALRYGGLGGDGGWASYEPPRGPRYCELLDCAELFKDVMIDYTYAECSSSCVHTLALFREQYPKYRRREVNRAISEGIACVLGKQLPDGGFYGSWGVCYTYGAWFVASALKTSKELPAMASHPHCMKLVDFLLAHQAGDGGWGEDVNACARQTWVDNPDGSQVVNTAWAVMAIMDAAGAALDTEPSRQRRIRTAVDRGVQLILSRQLADGDWMQERISGVFNGNNPIHYPGYKNCMPVWALGKYNAWKRKYVLAGTSAPASR